MKTKIDMDIKNIYIADSHILHQENGNKIYSILCLCGSDADVLQLATSFNQVFGNLNVETPESIANWISNDENLGNLMECLTVKNELSKLRLSCLVSNHSFAMMISYIKAVSGTMDISNPDISRTLESIYPEFERKCIPLFLKDMDVDVIAELFQNMKKCLSYSQESKGKNLLLKSFLPIPMQYNNVKDLCDKLFSDLSMSDYIQYVTILEKMNNDCLISDIYASNHSNTSLRKSITVKSIVEQSQPIIADLSTIKLLDNDQIKILFKKLVGINDYAWNRLCTEGTSENLTDNEKYLTITLWILFMGDYSSWMLSNKEYKRLSSIFEELRTNGN